MGAGFEHIGLERRGVDDLMYCVDFSVENATWLGVDDQRFGEPGNGGCGLT